jgi:hypothetical protein
MLLLDSRSLTIEGVTVFRDHADLSQFWYLPGPVALARRSGDQRKAFTFLKYKRAAGSATRGGGFLMFEVSLRLDPDTERRITERLASISRGRPRLTAVPFDDGTVACIALNLQGAGGTRAPAAATGAFNAVETILGASRPSLAGDNSAAFSLELSAEGATILEKAFREKTTPVGVIYDLKYTGLRPAFNVKITADFKQVFTHFSSAAEAQRGFLRAGIDAGFETLVRNGAIRIDVADIAGTPENETRIKEALDFFKAQVLNTWFTPVLVPGTLAAGMPAAASLDQVRALGAQLRPPLPAAPPKPDASAPTAALPDHGPSPTAGTGAGEAAPGLAAAKAAADATAADSPTAGTGNPAPAAPAPASGARGIAPRRDNAVAATADPPNAAEGAVAAFKLKTIRQEERRTATFEYNRAEAQQRGYAPQGFLGLLAADLDRPPYFVEIDLDDPFFRTIHVEAKVPTDFAAIGLSEVHLALDYGPPADPENHRHQDFVFTAADRGPKAIDFMVNLRKDQVYAMTTQYHFDPTSDWDGEKFAYEQPSVTTADRTPTLNPMEALGFLQVKVEPGRIDAEVVDFIDVELAYADPAGWSRTKTFRVTGQTPAANWKLRVSRDSPRAFTYKLIHHLKAGGDVRENPPVTTRATTVLVNDPFAGALEVTIFPTLDFASIRTAMLDVFYDDLANHYTRRQRVRLTPELTETVVRFSTVDPVLKRYRHELTIIRSDGRIERRPAVETEDDILSIVA